MANEHHRNLDILHTKVKVETRKFFGDADNKDDSVKNLIGYLDKLYSVTRWHDEDAVEGRLHSLIMAINTYMVEYGFNTAILMGDGREEKIAEGTITPVRTIVYADVIDGKIDIHSGVVLDNLTDPSNILSALSFVKGVASVIIPAARKGSEVLDTIDRIQDILCSIDAKQRGDIQ